MTGPQEISLAKQHLRKVLKENNYLTTNTCVIGAVEKLSELWKHNTESEDVKAPSKSKLALGNWNSLSSANYPGRISGTDSDVFQYTLGRISFNLFQPRNLICTINGVMNYVQKIKNVNGETFVTYSNSIDLTIHTDDGDLPAEIFISGHCSPESDTRSTVVFTGGELRKGASVHGSKSLTELWDKTFDGAYDEAQKNQGYVEWFMLKILIFMLDMTMPSDKSMKYEMKRPMKGYIDFLFLDDELRITRGNRGTIVIVERK